MGDLKRGSDWWLLSLAAVVLFSLLGWGGLLEPDEGRYAEIGREMAVTGDWLVPHLNGFEHFQKPPLLYWLTGASVRLLGANAWAARLPSALAALGTVLLTAWLGTTLLNRRAGFLAGLMLLSSVGFFAMARLLTPDMLLTFWITAALACFVQYAKRQQGRRWAYLFFGALGCGFLTKGPMALVVPITAVLAWQVAASRQKASQPLPWLGGLLLTLAIGLSWFVALSVWRHDLFAYFWRYELVERFASSHHGRSKPFWFFVPVVAVASLPWLFLLPQLSQIAWARLRQRTVSLPGWLLLGWCVPPFLVLSLSGSKLPTYILPLLPAMALGFAWLATRGGKDAPWVPHVAIAALVFLLAGVVALPLVNDHLGPQASIRTLTDQVRQDPALQHARVYAVEVRCHSLEFYLQRLVTITREQADIVLTPTPEQEQRLLSGKKFRPAMLEPAQGAEAVLVVVRRRRAAADFPPERWVQIAAAGDFLLLKSTGAAHAGVSADL